MFKQLVKYFIFSSLFFSSISFGAKVSVKLEDPDFSVAPPEDLVYRGARIDSSTAMDLKSQGVDLSQLSPRTSNLWSAKKLEANNQDELGYPAGEEVLSFKEFKTSPSEISRSVVFLGDQQFVLTASLDNHTNILRAALLRMLGYDLDTPKFYKSLKVKFKSKDQADEFINLVGEQTLTERGRWVKNKLDGNILELKGFTLEPAQLRNVNVYLPVMSRTRQESRRVFRALLNIFVLTDFPQSANSILWERGREFNGSLIFNHPYASDFPNATLEDLQWIQRKLLGLSLNDIAAAIEAMSLPEDLSALIYEKLLSRINYMSKLLRVKGPRFPENRNITQENIFEGKILKDLYSEDYVVEFYKEDELSPYRFWELMRLFKTQITYTSLSSLLDVAVEKFVPGLKMEDATQEIQNQMNDYRQNHPELQGVMPVKAFAQPLANGRGFATRNVVFGQYLGSTAPIQLVDSVGAEVSLGAFANISGVADNILPSASATASIGRTYTHVRAMPDLDAATSQEAKRLLIPRHFKSLGKVILDEYKCAIPEEPFKEEAKIGEEKVYYVKYDASWENGKERAIKKRQELIDSGITETILLVIIEREKLCEDEISETREKHLEEFLKQFALNEMFIVSDTLRLGARLNAPIPLATAGGASVNLNLTGESTYALLRSITVKRTADGMELTVQTQKNSNKSLSEGLSYFIELVSNSTKWGNGQMLSKVYKIGLEELNDEETQAALKTLRALFANNDRTLVEKTYSPIDLEHDVATRLNTFKFFFYKTESLQMGHDVEIVIPNRPDESFPLAQRTRRLYSKSAIKRSGNDYFNFMDRILASLNDFIGLGSGNNDPGKTVFGSSTKTAITTESELTSSRPLAPVSRVEFSWGGWNASTQEMNEIFNKVEAIFEGQSDAPILKRGILDGYSKVKSYDVRSSIIIYPSALKQLKQFIADSKPAEVIAKLKEAYGAEKWNRYCARAANFFGDSGPHLARLEGRTRVCAPSAARKFLKMKRQSLFPKEDPEKYTGSSQRRKELTNFYNDLIIGLFRDFRPSKALELIGADNFFATTRVTGFKERAPEGPLEYISNSVGEYNPDYGTGIYDTVAGFLGISSYELRAMMYTPSM